MQAAVDGRAWHPAWHPVEHERERDRCPEHWRWRRPANVRAWTRPGTPGLVLVPGTRPGVPGTRGPGPLVLVPGTRGPGPWSASRDGSLESEAPCVRASHCSPHCSVPSAPARA
eukprot:365467-Chlamydomonas_euryale.AAC.32